MNEALVLAARAAFLLSFRRLGGYYLGDSKAQRHGKILGTVSLSNSSRLPPSSPVSAANPGDVASGPGQTFNQTSGDRIRRPYITIGIVLVASLAAGGSRGPPDEQLLTLRRTSSAQAREAESVSFSAIETRSRRSFPSVTKVTEPLPHCLELTRRTRA